MEDSIAQPLACVCCGNSKCTPVLTAKDYTVSQQSFTLLECDNCKFRFTENAPGIADIGKYYAAESYISHTNTNKGLINQLYHWVRSFTLGSKRRLINRTSKLTKGNLLDVGAGTGFFVEEMKKAGWQVTGLEPDEQARERAMERAGIQLQNPEVLWKLAPASFDVITLWHVLEHVHDLEGYLRQFHHLLRPNGILIIAVPNYQSHDAGHYQASWAAYDVPRHLYHFSPRSMDYLLKAHQFQSPQLYPMWFDAFYVSMLSEKYATGKDNPIRGACEGLVSNLTALFDKKKTSSLIYITRPV
jgi:SAM-dependent methyltransferase